MSQTPAHHPIVIKPNPEPGGFLDELMLVWVGGKRPYKLLTRYRFDSHIAGMVEAEPGYLSDFASIPRLFWRILPPHGPYVPAAVIHDWLCHLRGSTGINSPDTHRVFLEAMEVLRVPGWKRCTMYWAVKLFGPRF